MADYDLPNAGTPTQAVKRPTAPTVANLKSALNTYNATSYTAARMLTMTYNDLVYACRLHGLSVAGL